MITTNSGGFTEAGMAGEDGAKIRATLDDEYFVIDCFGSELFSLSECREAAAFFTKLAEELERRSGALAAPE
jgi:hypothetical protein